MHGVICPGLPVSMITIIKWELEARSIYKSGFYFLRTENVQKSGKNSWLHFMDIDVLREQVLFMIQMETCPQLSEFHLAVVMILTPKCAMLQKHQRGSKPLSWDSSLWLVELHFLVTMPQTKAKIQGPKGSAMYADVQNKRRNDSCAKNVTQQNLYFCV